MDYLLNTYLFSWLPVEVSEETRKSISERGMQLVQLADWACKAQDPRRIWDNHTSFLFCELVFFLLCALTFSHAVRHGGRYLFTWIAILVHALNVENLCYWIPDLDNFWQAQGILTLFGARAPLYIILGIYHTFDYIAYVFVRRLRLPWWAEGPAVGLGAVMLDMPYDIMGIKLLWWTWHDTDPNIYDRMYWVPWNSYYFHAAFACSFTWILHGTRRLFLRQEYDWRKFHIEFVCAFLAGTLAFWLGTIQFALLYHPLHDIFKVHSEITTCLFLATYAVIVYSADRSNGGANPDARTGNRFWWDELACAAVIHYGFYMMLVLVADPANIVAEGLHQPIGPCNQTQSVQTPTGLVLSKKKFLCADNYDEGYFDWHCIPGGQPRQVDESIPLEWYAACGTPFHNRVEYIAIIWGICILFPTIFYQFAVRSGTTPVDPVAVLRKRQAKPEVNAGAQSEETHTKATGQKQHSPTTTVRQRTKKSPDADH